MAIATCPLARYWRARARGRRRAAPSSSPAAILRYFRARARRTGELGTRVIAREPEWNLRPPCRHCLRTAAAVELLGHTKDCRSRLPWQGVAP